MHAPDISPTHAKMREIARDILQLTPTAKKLEMSDLWDEKDEEDPPMPKIMSGVFNVPGLREPLSFRSRYWSVLDQKLGKRRWEIIKKMEIKTHVIDLNATGKVLMLRYRLKFSTTRQNCGYLRELFEYIPSPSTTPIADNRIVYICQRLPRMYTNDAKLSFTDELDLSPIRKGKAVTREQSEETSLPTPLSAPAPAPAAAVSSSQPTQQLQPLMVNNTMALKRENVQNMSDSHIAPTAAPAMASPAPNQILTFEIVFQPPNLPSVQWYSLWREKASIELWTLPPPIKRHWLDYVGEILLGLSRWFCESSTPKLVTLDILQFRIPQLLSFPSKFGLSKADYDLVSSVLSTLDSAPFARVLFPRRYMNSYSNISAFPHWSGGHWEGSLSGVSGHGTLRIGDHMYVGPLAQETLHGRGRLYRIAPNNTLMSCHHGEFVYGVKHGPGEEWQVSESGVSVYTLGVWENGELKIVNNRSQGSDPSHAPPQDHFVLWNKPLQLVASSHLPLPHQQK